MTKWCWDLKDKQLTIREDSEGDWNDFDSAEEARAWFHEIMLKLVIGINALPEFDTLAVPDGDLERRLMKQAQEYVRALEV